MRYYWAGVLMTYFTALYYYISYINRNKYVLKTAFKFRVLNENLNMMELYPFDSV